MQKNKAHRADKINTRTRFQAAMARAREWGRNAANAARKRIVPDVPDSQKAHWAEQLERQRLIRSMTNWQRNQAGRACKGDWDRLTTERLVHFADLPHWKKAGQA